MANIPYVLSPAPAINEASIIPGSFAPALGSFQSYGRVYEDPAYSLVADPIDLLDILPGVENLTQFAAGHGYSSNAGGSHDYNSVENVLIGDQSFRAVSSGAGAYKYCQKLNAAPFSIEGKMLSILLEIDKVEHLDELQIFIGDATLTAHRKWSNLEGSQSTKWLISGKWCLLTFALGWGYTSAGVIDPAAVTSIRISFRDDSAEAVTIDFQSIDLFDASTTAFSSIVFDDGRTSIFDLAFPILRNLNLTASVAMPHDVIGTSGYLTEAQLHILQDSGWEIVAHATGNDMRGMTEAEIKQYLLESKEYWSTHGFDVSGFAYSGGEFGPLVSDPDTTVADIVIATGFSWARSINESSPETLPAADPYRLRTIYVTNADLPASVTPILDNCAAHGNWAFVVLHQIIDGVAAATTEYTKDDLILLAEHLSENTICANPSRVLQHTNLT